MHQKLGNTAQAETYYRKALKLDERLGRDHGRAATLGNLGLLLENRGQLDEAERMMEEALAIDRKLQLRKQEATELHNLASIALTRGDRAKAKGFYEQALAINRELKLRDREADNLASLGTIERHEGRLERAEQLFQDSLRISKDLDYKEGEVIALHNLADILAGKDSAAAEAMYKDALRLNEQLGRKQGQARNLGKLGQLNRDRALEAQELGLADRKRSLLSQAADYHKQAIALYEQVDNKEGRAAELFNLGLVALLNEDRDECYRLWSQSRQLYAEMGIAHEVADIDKRIAHFKLGGERRALTRDRAAISILTAMTFADGELQDQEREWLTQRRDNHPWFGDLSADEFMDVMSEALAALRAQPWRELVTQWAQAIPPADREEMFGMTLHLGMADDEPLGQERPLLDLLQQCFQISPERVQEIFQEKIDDV
jgi:tetratricopeptide (TPR) repeat protein